MLLEEAASSEGRSLTSEIVYRLERSFDTVHDLMLVNRAAELKQAARDIEQVRIRLEDLVDDPDTPPDLIAMQKNLLDMRIKVYEGIKHSIEKLNAEHSASITRDAASALIPTKLPRK